MDNKNYTLKEALEVISKHIKELAKSEDKISKDKKIEEKSK